MNAKGRRESRPREAEEKTLLLRLLLPFLLAPLLLLLSLLLLLVLLLLFLASVARVSASASASATAAGTVAAEGAVFAGPVSVVATIAVVVLVRPPAPGIAAAFATLPFAAVSFTAAAFAAVFGVCFRTCLVSQELCHVNVPRNEKKSSRWCRPAYQFEQAPATTRKVAPRLEHWNGG